MRTEEVVGKTRLVPGGKRERETESQREREGQGVRRPESERENK